MTLPRWLAEARQPLAFGSFRNWVRLLRDNGGFDRAYTQRALFTTTVSLLTAPLRVAERLRYNRLIRETVITEPPIFIVGHWRSGTTHLHNVLCQDERLGYVTTFQTIAPELFLLGNRTIRPLVAKLAPTRRPMDNVALSLDGPQEEEFALVNMSPHSFYHYWSFPRRARDYFEKYALFRGVGDGVVAEWKTVYMEVLKKATLNMGGKRLVIKNPTNTGRIRVLVEMFPDAKFIHIYRNPFTLLPSTMNFYEKTLAFTRLQDISREEVRGNVVYFFQEIMQQFLEEKRLIPQENLVEVRFEDLEANPLVEVRRVYEHLGLPGYEDVEPVLGAYVAAQAGYRKNSYILRPEDVETVRSQWQFAVEAWGYKIPEGSI